MDNWELDDRLELATTRLREWVKDNEVSELPEVFRAFALKQAELLEHAVAVLADPVRMATSEVNSYFYGDIAGEAYENSFTNPAVCESTFDAGVDKSLNWFATHVRDVITAAYEGDTWTLVVWLELFLELIGILSEDVSDAALKEMFYYFIHDYDEIRMEKNIRELVVPDEDSLAYTLVMKRDHTDTGYLYEYGEYISDNELTIADFLSAMPEEKLEAMAATYTQGYKKGFEAAGIDLSLKKSVEIRYPIGFEPMVKKAVEQFEVMGLRPTIRRRTNTQAIGVVSTPPNRQYLHDHRFDESLYMNHALLSERMKHAKKSFEDHREEAYTYAGPAVIETFGEALFVPATKASAPKYSKEQEKLDIEYRRDYALMQDEFIPGDKRSFTIIAYPIPEIGKDFRDIFQETVKINTLDTDVYQRIHQAIIDALDEGEYVHVWGMGDNRTDIRVMLHKLDDPATQTNFENCLADVNIPVGEVFT